VEQGLRVCPVQVAGNDEGRIGECRHHAFCKDLFSGNPAAVCPLDSWPKDGLLQNIAAENNLAETAHYVPEGDGFRLRWFTPSVEVDLCGHATLATAHVLFEQKGFAKDTIFFYSRNGELRVKRSGDELVLDFPADLLTTGPVTNEMSRWFGTRPLEAYIGGKAKTYLSGRIWVS
jgi:PhzF family phenazine biosynthesis protein